MKAYFVRVSAYLTEFDKVSDTYTVYALSEEEARAEAAMLARKWECNNCDTTIVIDWIREK